MPNLDQESLFSVELVVDRLCLSKTTVCRFPAVAFRLLDFPTLVIHHVDLELAEMLRSKISADPYYKLPVKFSEFQDREGNFVVQKGKSCLFKVSPNTLQMHLANAPLYVMIMDTYPSTPKLIGSCSVPLNIVMDELYDEICQQGVAIPLVNGDNGSFDIFNLMGIKLGSIDMSYRLLSLGGALLRHIPDHLVAQVKSQENPTIQPPSEQFWKASIVPQISPSAEANNNRKSETEVSHAAEKCLKDSKMQTDEACVGNVGVQTMKRRPHSRFTLGRQNSPALDNMERDDVIITNVICPPPLYYNSEADVSAAVSLFRKQQAWMQHHNQSDEDDLSDDGTIRQEDKFSDTDELEFKQRSSAPSDYPQKKTQLKRSVPKVSQLAHVGQQAIFSQMAQFPILQALMAELMQLQGVPVSSTSTSSARRTRDPGYKDIRRNPFASGLQTDQLSPSRHERVVHSCAKTHVIVPTTKSWVTKEKWASAKVSQLELVPGLTHTQRLRLSKHNPKLLKELEAKEEERIVKWKEQRAQKKQVKNFTGAGAIVEKSVLESGDRNIVQGLERDNGLSTTLNQYHSYRRPVPTPRSTLSNKKLDNETENPDGITKSDGILISGFAIKDLDATRALGNANSHQETAIKSQLDIRNSRLPGFGETLIIHKGSENTSDKTYFSDDKIQAGPKLEGKEPGLRKIVEKNSHTEDREENAAVTGSNPLLQKVVRSYSYEYDKSTETSLDAGFQLCEEPTLQKIIDHYSNDSDENNSETEEIHAANSKSTFSNAKDLKPGTSGNGNKLNAAKSPLLPITGTQNPLDVMRHPIFESSETVSSEMPVLHEAALSQENLSTSRRTPRTKGKLSQELSELASSASVGFDTFSDALETPSEEDSGEIKYLETKDIKIAANAKLGYTWT